MQKVLISIIVPIYNAQNYIGNCLNSILSNTSNDFEVIIVNDGSTDSSQIIIEAYSDERIKLYNQRNLGASAARNKGIELANGKYIMFVDADDWLEEDYIDIIFPYINQNYDAIIFDVYKWDSYGKKRKCKHFLPNEYFYDMNKTLLFSIILSTYDFNSPVARLYSSEIIMKNNIRFPEDVVLGEDSIFNLQYFYFSEKGLVVHKYIYNYHYNINSVTKTFQLTGFNDVLTSFKMRQEYAKLYFGSNYSSMDKLIYKIYEYSINELFRYIRNALYSNVNKEILKRQLNDSMVKKILLYKCKISFATRLKKIFLQFKMLNFIKLFGNKNL